MMSEEMKDAMMEQEAVCDCAEERMEETQVSEVTVEAAEVTEATETAEVIAEAEPAETMADYAAELEASFKRVQEGDILTGTVIDVTEDQVILDLKYYAEGIITKEEISNDPEFMLQQEIHAGDEITATVIKRDDGEGNILLSRKEANDVMAWDKLVNMMNERTIVNVKIAEIVKGGAVAFLEGIRGFIPASKLAAEYVENLEDYSGKTIEVTVITADEEEKRLVLSGKEPARAKLQEEKKARIAKCEVGAVMDGTVDTIKDYGAFVSLENGLSGLLHISQISNQRIKHPGAVLKEGQTVKVKIISTKDNKISLSMKVLESAEEDQPIDIDYHEDTQATTGLGALLKGLKF